MKYVAVGFKVSKSRSIFYITETDTDRFFAKLNRFCQRHDPDFVSLRMVKE